MSLVTSHSACPDGCCVSVIDTELRPYMVDDGVYERPMFEVIADEMDDRMHSPAIWHPTPEGAADHAPQMHIDAIDGEHYLCKCMNN